MTNFNSNSTPSDNQPLEVIQELQKLLATAIQAAGGSIGVKSVIRLMQFSGQGLEVIQELQKLLATAIQAAGGSIGVESVIRLIMEFSGVCAPLATQLSPTVAEILEEVEDAGIKLTPGLVIKINKSPFQKVRDTIAIYTKVYGKGGGDKPARLFCEILENEVRKSKP